ncbi:hypothetical protein BDY24DRAFT_112687 [Mrakia frigida]|uniref:uncharacterized protein n=1 Tax=Mrakia frigida TaxID=29902 RepID=UPI003FCC1D67
MSQQQHQQRQLYLQELSEALFHFILPLLPTPEELALKSQVRTLLERLVRTVEPNCRLLRFGSTANGFSLRNSDMDLCVLLEGEEPRPAAAELVTLIGSLLERETNFAVKALPKAYVPIIKLSLAPSPGLPFGIACDIGFENRLALENTRLLLTYATVDPARVRTMVLFLKVWSKRRKINSPYRGTLSSYGYTLLVLFFLIHIQSPPVLPNLQRIPPTRPVAKEDMELDGHDIWFFDDTESLRKGWSSSNLQSVGELLIDFFRFYCNIFAFNTDVVSIRAGLLTKESKQWTTDSDVGGINEMARDRNRLCIEDPFETSYNVARTVTKDGLYTIRGEFMRASRILTGRPERAVTALAQLCEATHGRPRRSTLSSASQLLPPAAGSQQRWPPQRRRSSSSSPPFQPHSFHPATPPLPQRFLFSIRLGLRRSSSSTVDDFLSRASTRLLASDLTQGQPSSPVPALRSVPRARSRLLDWSSVGRRSFVGQRITSPAAADERRRIRRRSWTRNGSSSVGVWKVRWNSSWYTTLPTTTLKGKKRPRYSQWLRSLRRSPRTGRTRSRAGEGVDARTFG